ncbi:AAA domain-containing protein [Amycolatopsis sp. PS_44_ISF1]|uniref:DEAD/DEAH box helicase n=1 Tax=Amycolatopsis sp. PS_44_ISF1 TaxID=2974917 RepID=UPI0028DDBDA5|nr:AAA domain-containing protein [Amycolatopsis sp. PS_44_ISF1]MDT8913589.1 AAA domain-containing protein [Amycolatopsis sp. PS_44_ISF1]
MTHGDDHWKRQAQIVRYWRAVEYFSPPKVDSVDPDKNVRAVRKGRGLPWESGVLKPAKTDYVWRHTVYAGIFDVSKVRELLLNVLRAPDGERDFDGRVGGQTALLSFAVDSTGHLLKDSITLSSCAWAVSRTVLPGPGSPEWLTGFEADESRLMDYLFEIGDGKIAVEPSGGKPTGLIAGTAARVALDIVTGGISALPAVIGMVAAPAVGSIAAKVIEKVGDAFAKDSNDSIGAVVKEKKEKREQERKSEIDGQDAPVALGGKVLTVDDLAAITRWVAETLGIAEVLRPDSIRVKSTQIPARSANEVASDDFLNSFYADDLERVAKAVEDKDIGPALAGYLRSDESIDVQRRVDLRSRPQAVLSLLRPQSMPLGRWPAEPDRPLTLSQQFAINQIVESTQDPASTGVYAVNGPPGTGKTTMLRDMIAALVVDRAMRLSKLKNAREAFAKKPVRWTVDEGGKPRTKSIHPLRSDLTGFEIVIASSNNGAVENITLEVPAAKTIDRETFPEADYLAEPATLLTGTPCWGAVAARMGRRGNRLDFVDQFWRGIPDRRKKASREAQKLRGLNKILFELGNSLENDLPSWPEAVARFNAAVDEVRRLVAEREVIADLLVRRNEPDATLRSLRGKAESARGEVGRLQAHERDLRLLVESASNELVGVENAVRNAQHALVSAQDRINRASLRLQAADTRLRNHAESKPGFWRKMLSRQALSDWTNEGRPLTEGLAHADQLADEAERQYSNCVAVLTARQRDLNIASEKVGEWRARLIRCTQAVAQAHSQANASVGAIAAREAALEHEAEQLADAYRRWPKTVPGDEWRVAPDDRAAMEQRETSAPWMDEELAAARSRVFLAALDLHRAVLTTEPEFCRKNLLPVMDVVGGSAPADLPESTVLAAWQLLFLVVPVVSTTFASMPRMFAALGREALGWLFVDEAGQAVPQAAVGALWRTQRAVIVGDPLQLEPVVTLPWSGQTRLCHQFGVDRQWAPQNGSVQSIADRLNIFGTWLPGSEGSGYAWVGSPLRVHRRCDRLMFEVSNNIAYDGMMVYGVPTRPHFDLALQDTWLDVGAQPKSSSKWNPLDGRCVNDSLELIRKRIGEQMDAELEASGNEPPEWASAGEGRNAELLRRLTAAVFVVSPFREVVQELRNRKELEPLTKAARVGTVHTTQGKEADIVILVLGTATDQEGARDWASRTPNLLNVAVTRARRRLIVIGDYQNWSKHPNFSVLAGYGMQNSSGLLKVVKYGGK